MVQKNFLILNNGRPISTAGAFDFHLLRCAPSDRNPEQGMEKVCKTDYISRIAKFHHTSEVNASDSVIKTFCNCSTAHTHSQITSFVTPVMACYADVEGGFQKIRTIGEEIVNNFLRYTLDGSRFFIFTVRGTLW